MEDGGWSDTSLVRGCVSQQINQHSDGSARSCAIEISLVVVIFFWDFTVLTNKANAERADTLQGCVCT